MNTKRPAHRVGARKSRRPEKYYVRVQTGDGESQFFPATEHIGKPMPFTKPRELCAVRVFPDVVTFSLVHLTKKAIATVRERNIEMPNQQLSRLARTAADLDIDGDQLVAIGNDGTMRRYVIVRDANNIAELVADTDIPAEQIARDAGAADSTPEAADGGSDGDAPEEGDPADSEPGTDNAAAPRKRTALYAEPIDVSDEPAFELDRRGERISLFFFSPVLGRKVALGYNGHLGRPGGNETLARCVAKVLHAALAVGDFAALANMSDIEIPVGMGARIQPPVTATPATVTVPVALFNTERERIAHGTMTVSIDLTHAPVSADRLFFTITPSAEIEEHFGPYRAAAEKYVNDQLPTLVGDEIRAIVVEIVIGEVEASTVERLNDMLKKMSSVFLAPDTYAIPQG